MNHELLLNTELPKIDNKPVTKASLSSADNDVKADSPRAFSSELNDQVSKQTTQKSDAVASTSRRSDRAISEEKAESIHNKNGKPLPDLAVDASTIGQTIADIVKQVSPEDKDTVKDALLSAIKALTNNKSDAEQVAHTDNIIAEIEDVTETLVDKQAVSTTNQSLDADKLIEDLNAIVTSSDSDEITNSEDLGAIAATTNKQGRAAESSVIPPLVLQIRELTSQIKDVVADTKLSKTERGNSVGQAISEWVKKVGLLARTASEQVNKVESDVVPKTSLSNHGQEIKELKIRPDILQALTNKVVNDESKQGVATLGNKGAQQSLNSDGSAKTIERVAQLVDTFKPEKTEGVTTHRAANEKANMPNFGAVPANPTSITSETGVKTTALDIQPTLHSQAWNKVVASRVVWMAKEGVQQASLQLNPANLGPVEVRVSMQNDQTTVVFLAQNALTRDALEQALPRLRESFSENGLQLVDADVAEQFQGNGHDQDDAESQSPQLNDGSIIMAVDTADIDEIDLSTQQENIAGLSVYV